MHIDEHVLAAYISGELSIQDRRIVSSKLVEDHSLREWLHMASMALSAALGEQEEGPHMRLLSTKEPVFPGYFRSDRAPVQAKRNTRHAV